jgi:NAD+ synthase
METPQTDRPSLQERLEIDAAQTSAEIVTFLRREVERLARRGVVIGLSGGLDSTVCAYLCARAVGPERVWALLMPERDSAPGNVADAQLVAHELGLNVTQLDLSPILQHIGVYDLAPAELAGDRSTLESAIRWLGRLTPGPSPFAQALSYAYGERRALWKWIVRRFLWPYAGRAQAFVLSKVRLRMLLLYHHAALSDCLVVGTTDRSEWQIGFYDPNGDGACDVALLRHLYKTQIRQLARYLGVPPAIIDKPSSGDLAAGLPNEMAIGLPYEQLDAILLGVEQGLSNGTIAAQTGIAHRTVRAVRRATATAEARRHLPITITAYTAS